MQQQQVVMDSGAMGDAIAIENGRVVVDLSAVRLQWTPALQAFPSTSAAVGAPNVVPCKAASVTAETIAGCAWP